MKYIKHCLSTIALCTMAITPLACQSNNNSLVGAREILRADSAPGSFVYTPTTFANAAPLKCSYDGITPYLTIAADVSGGTWTEDKNVYIPEKIINPASKDEYIPWKIDKDGFKSAAARIKGIFLADATSLDSIGDSAFESCKIATEIQLPKNLVSIGDKSFYLCEDVESINFDNLTGIRSIGANAFDGCDSVTSPIILPSTLEEIKDFAFNNMLNITAIDLTKCESIVSIGTSAFAKCGSALANSLEAPLFLQNTASIGANAFNDVYVPQIHFVYRNISIDNVPKLNLKFEAGWQPTLAANATITKDEIHFPENLQDTISALPNFGLSAYSAKFVNSLYLTQFSFETDKMVVYNNDQFVVRVISNYGSDNSWEVEVNGELDLLEIKPETTRKTSYIVKANGSKLGDVGITAKSIGTTIKGEHMTSSMVISIQEPKKIDVLGMTLAWTIPIVVCGGAIAALWFFGSNKKKPAKSKRTKK